MDVPRKRPWSQKARLPLVIGMAVIGLLGLAWAWFASASRVDGRDVAVEAVRQVDFKTSVSLVATVQGRSKAKLSSNVAGQVQSVLARRGDPVDTGTVLVRLRNQQLESEVLARSAEVTQQIATLFDLRVALEQRELEYERQDLSARQRLEGAASALVREQDLHDKGMVALAAIENRQREKRFAEAELKAVQNSHSRFVALRDSQLGDIEATVAKLRRGLKAAEESLGQLEIRSPLVGVLSDLNVEVGQGVAAGQTLGQIDSAGEKILVARAEEYFVGRIMPGDDGIAQIGGVRMPVVVERVSEAVVDKRIEVWMAVKSNASVRVGQSVSVLLKGSSSRPALVIPYGSYIEDTKRQWVFVMDSDGRTAVRTKVILGERNDSQIIVEDGLRVGDQIIVSSYGNFVNDERIRIR